MTYRERWVFQPPDHELPLVGAILNRLADRAMQQEQERDALAGLDDADSIFPDLMINPDLFRD